MNEAPSADARQAASSGRLAFGPRLALGSLLALAVVLAYLPALSGGFVYDDLLLVQGNPRLASFGAVARSFTEPHWSFAQPGAEQVGFWRPLTVVVLALGRALGGGEPFAHHLFSLGLHLAASLACWRLARRLLGSDLLGFLVAAIFGLHPVHVESVAWISAVNDPLFALFALLSLDAFVAWRARGSPGVPWLAAAWLAPALLAKEQALAVVPMALALDLGLWVSGLWVTGRGDGRPRRWLAAYAPLLAVVALYLGLRTVVFESPLAGLDRAAASFGFPLERSLSLRVEIFGGFLGLLAWPSDLAVFRMVRPVLPSPDAGYYLALLLVVLWGIAVAFALQRRSGLALASLLLVPASFVLLLLKYESAGAFPISDRYLYLAVAGWGVLLAVVATRVLPRELAIGALGLVAFSMGLKTFAQGAIYTDEETFFRAAVEASPRSPYVRWGMGRVLLDKYTDLRDKQILDEAFFHFITSLALGTDYGERRPKLGPDAGYGDRAVELSQIVSGTPPAQRRPDPTVMWSTDDRLQANLGQGYCYLFLAELPPDHDLDAPLIVFQATAVQWPGSYDAHTALGSAYHAKGEQARRLGDAEAAEGYFQRAKESFGRAIGLNPAHAEAWSNLGRTLALLEDWDAARAAFEKALAQRPGQLADRLEVAKCAMEANRFELAERRLSEARSAHPESVMPLFWMGVLEARRRAWADALAWFDRVIARQPRHPSAHLQKAKVLISMGETGQAIQALGIACELAPDNFEAHYQRAYLQAQVHGDPEQAKDYVRRAYRLSPPGAERRALHGFLAQATTVPIEALVYAVDIGRKGDHALALDWIDRALALAERDPATPDLAEVLPRAHHLRGRTLEALARTLSSPDLAKSKLAQARDSYLRTLDFQPDHFWANHSVALVMRRLGEPAGAFQPYAQRALEILPEAREEGLVGPEIYGAVEETLRALVTTPVDGQSGSDGG